MQQRSDKIASRSQLLDLVETLGFYARIGERKPTKIIPEGAQGIFKRPSQRAIVRPTSVLSVQSR